jgi:hypothetical protein
MVRRAVVPLASALVVFGLAASHGPERTFTYRVEVRGAVTADVEEFARHAASTLSDHRGWTLGGSVEFRQVSGHADFTLWLSTAAQVPSFSSLCSSEWSCRVGPNVIINEDRWQRATPTWPYGRASYRDYVINHEVGHWLGEGHWSCPGGTGTRAPVMAQQSKGRTAMGQCRFNVWPTEAERRSVAQRHGVTVRPTGLPNPDDPFGSLDRLEVERDAEGRPIRVRAVGWTIDGDSTDPIGVVVLGDDSPVAIADANRRRPDVGRAFPRYGSRHGFDHTVDIDPATSEVCVVAIGVGAGLPFNELDCRVVK